MPGLRPLGPDVAVFRDAPAGWDGGTLGMDDTDARPVLVVEVTSPDTRKNDFGVKKDFYHRAGVPTYVIVDARPNPKKGRRVRLLGFRWSPGGYDPIPPDDRDRVWLGDLGLWMTIIDRKVACIDGRTGEKILGFAEPAARRAEAIAAARAEADARAIRAEERSRVDAAARAEAEERSKADAAARAEAEERSRAEAAARADLEARLRAMEAENRRLRGGG